MPTVQQSQNGASSSSFGLFEAAHEYMTDGAQRFVLFLDALRQRGNNYREHAAQTAPHVLNFEVELLIDGRRLDRPVNYALVRVVPPEGISINPTFRPFVVVDPRAGHGPGIGGFKSESEIGVAFKAGHPCYFVGFLPEPMPGQTIEDIAHAEAIFLEKVIALHPDAEGKPCVIGNCQAGWAIMMLAAIRPELFGPIIVAGSPLSYWAGVRGQYPMRYSGGLLGGSWLTALTSDLGHGKFDGAWLVQNFESQNPANTLWTKSYNLYSKVDTEAQRYLEFERWWGGHVVLNAAEMQFIVDELFIGNKLSSGAIKTSDGTAIDLRNIRSPIVVFCSKGDNITPPQQALGWILELYDDVEQIRSFGQTIVYSIHESVGHLGIFVSSGVARKEYGEFSTNIDLIDVLPPGLYEAVLVEKSAETNRSDLVVGEWLMRCEPRTLEDIRALGGSNPADERRFATAARVSETNLALYRSFAQPTVRALMSSQSAELLSRLHPLRLQYELFSDENPLMAPIAALASQVTNDRKPVSATNPFLALQEHVSRQVVAALDQWRAASESFSEKAFLSIYGSPMLQASMGINPESAEPLRKSAKSQLHKQLVESKIAELKSKIGKGGLRTCLVRAALYVGMSRGGSVDERAFELVRRIRFASDDITRLTLAEFKALVREQHFILLIDEQAALSTIPSLLPASLDERQKAIDIIREILSARGEIVGETADRLKHIVRLFGVEDSQVNLPRIVRRETTTKDKRPLAS
jgi:pimeloyl-ACP methyl ester carboxylesterase